MRSNVIGFAEAHVIGMLLTSRARCGFLTSNRRRNGAECGHRWGRPTICVVFAYTEEAEEEALADENVDITAGPTLLLAALAKLLRKSETESA